MTRTANAHWCSSSRDAPPQNWLEECHENIDLGCRSGGDEVSDTWFWNAPPAEADYSLLRTTLDARQPLPTALRHISEVIENSRTILQLQDDWDEAGALPISEQTWRRATEFLSRYVERVWDTSGDALDAPDIAPVPDGSIDLHWDSPTYEMLINIPSDARRAAGFYGDDRDRISIKGHFDPQSVNEGLLQWLRKAT